MQDWFLAYNGNFMVTLTLNTSKFLLIYRYLQNTYWFRAWSLSCHSFHAIKAFVLPWLSKRATPKAPRQCKYIESTIDNERQNRRSQWGLYIIHLMRRSRCFVLTISLKLRSSYGVKTKAYSYALYRMYVCPTSAHRGFRYGYRRYKDNTFTLKTTLFGWQSMILRSDLTLLNINMSKKSTFGDFSR